VEIIVVKNAQTMEANRECVMLCEGKQVSKYRVQLERRCCYA